MLSLGHVFTHGYGHGQDMDNIVFCLQIQKLHFVSDEESKLVSAKLDHILMFVSAGLEMAANVNFQSFLRSFMDGRSPN